MKVGWCDPRIGRVPSAGPSFCDSAGDRANSAHVLFAKCRTIFIFGDSLSRIPATVVAFDSSVSLAWLKVAIFMTAVICEPVLLERSLKCSVLQECSWTTLCSQTRNLFPVGGSGELTRGAKSRTNLETHIEGTSNHNYTAGNIIGKVAR